VFLHDDKQEHIVKVFLLSSGPHPRRMLEERLGFLHSFHLVLAHVDPQVIARGKKGSVESPNMCLGM